MVTTGRDAETGNAGARIVAAIGNFDGVHLGHQALLAETRAFADELGASAGALVFEPHPRRFFRPEEPPFLITSRATRAALINACGAPFVLSVPFDATLAALSPEEFVDRVLVERLGLAGVVAGEEFRFGAGRAGDAAMLRDLAEARGLVVRLVSPLLGGAGAAGAEGGEKIGSSGVRAAIERGDMAGAAEMLGRLWSVSGRVVEGRRLGRTIGFPTANIGVGNLIAPRRGVYAVRVALAPDHDEDNGPEDDKADDAFALYDGVANYGARPTVDGAGAVLEVNLFNFNEDIYGRRLRVAFVEFIREEKKYESVDALAAQIAKDSDRAKAILRLAPPPPATTFPRAF